MHHIIILFYFLFYIYFVYWLKVDKSNPANLSTVFRFPRSGVRKWARYHDPRCNVSVRLWRKWTLVIERKFVIVSICLQHTRWKGRFHNAFVPDFTYISDLHRIRCRVGSVYMLWCCTRLSPEAAGKGKQ